MGADIREVAGVPPDGQPVGEDDEFHWGEDEFGPFRYARPWTMNEIRDHPMFMEDVPQNIDDNPHLLALQSILYDGQSQEELAEHFKNLGNEAFRSSTNKISSQNALMAYTKGLEMECKDDSLNSQLHSNRAAVSQRLKEHSKAVDDCRKAVQLDPANLKAYHRAAKSSDALGLTSQAIKFCDVALSKIANAEVKQFRDQLAKKLDRELKGRERDKQNNQAAAKRRGDVDAAVKAQLEGRGLRMGPQDFDLTMYVAGGNVVKPTFAEGNEAILWPMLFLYDETGQSDFVEKFDERCSLEDQLQLMFPEDRQVEWDEEGKYVWHRLAVYLEWFPEGASEARMASVAVTPCLQDVLAGVECVSPCLSFHVLVKDTPAHRHFCHSHDLPC